MSVFSTVKFEMLKSLESSFSVANGFGLIVTIIYLFVDPSSQKILHCGDLNKSHIKAGKCPLIGF